MPAESVSSSPPLRLGILGLGEGVSILSAAVQSPLAEPYLLCDLNEDLCRQRAAAFGLNRYTTDYHAMLAWELHGGCEDSRVLKRPDSGLICLYGAFNGPQSSLRLQLDWADLPQETHVPRFP